MKHNLRHTAATALVLGLGILSASAQDAFWVQTANRFTAPTTISFEESDSVVFLERMMRVYKDGRASNYQYSNVLEMSSTADSSAAFYLGTPERAVWKPTTSDNQYNNDYTNPASKWNFQRSKESEHFIAFWDEGFGENPNAASVPAALRVDVDDLLQKAEQFFATNVNRLKMATLGEGKSYLDTYKMSIYLLYQTDWLATGSGYDNTIGALWVNPSTCKPVGHTIAHEIGHSFQYQVASDFRKQGVSNYMQRGWRYGFGSNGSGGNGFWEQCAQWQGFQDYPSEVFGYHIDVWKRNYHRHFNHEWMRYASYWWPYHLVEKHGAEAYGRLWRESRYPEDPLETYTRLFCDGDVEVFWNDYFEYATKLPNYQFQDVHQYMADSHYTPRSYKTQMYKTDDDFWQVAYASCPETSGLNIIPMAGFAQGGEVQADFRALAPGSPLHASDPGHALTADDGSAYTSVTTFNTTGKAENANFRCAFVAVAGDETYVSDVLTGTEGTITFTVPSGQGAVRLSLLVVATPKQYGRHEWNEKDIDDVQWPYQVKLTGCRPSGL